MSNEKFTQGEWKVERLDIDEGGCPHFMVMCLPGDNGGIRIDCEIIQSTAALIAAAPPMYRVLSGICFEKSAQICKFAPESCEVCQIRKALKKARGEE